VIAIQDSKSAAIFQLNQPIVLLAKTSAKFPPIFKNIAILFEYLLANTNKYSINIFQSAALIVTVDVKGCEECRCAYPTRTQQ
jgi:hypothetical protein